MYVFSTDLGRGVWTVLQRLKPGQKAAVTAPSAFSCRYLPGKLYRYTVCRGTREESPSASFPWLQVTVSQFVFFPQTPLGASFCLRRERKFGSKIKNERKMYVYTSPQPLIC